MYITRLASNEIFSPSNKIHREVSWAKDLSVPRYLDCITLQGETDRLSQNIHDILPFYVVYNTGRPYIPFTARGNSEIKPSSKYSVLCYMSHPPLLPESFSTIIMFGRFHRKFSFLRQLIARLVSTMPRAKRRKRVYTRRSRTKFESTRQMSPSSIVHKFVTAAHLIIRPAILGGHFF